MRIVTTTATFLAASLLLAGFASAASTDPSRTVCGAWAPPHYAAGCGTVTVTWTAPTCTGNGNNYRCTVLFTEKWDVLGAGCALSDVNQYGNGYGGVCTTGGASATLGPISVTYTDIPEDGRSVIVTDTACFSSDSGTPLQPVPGSSTCQTWTVGTISIPGETTP